jgi:RNase P/RNase MRP subunit p29
MVSRILAAGALLSLASCGYHVAGHTDLLPKSIQTVCIPAFANTTTRYKLTDRIPEALSRELISRTRYHVVSDCNRADAALTGAVINYISGATVFDQASGRATAVDIHVYMQVKLTERVTGKTLFSRPNMEVRERYEVSVNPLQYFDESDAGLDRVSKSVARQVISSILENF